jgi:diguanylate cyclase (GGDEF)-like protein
VDRQVILEINHEPALDFMDKLLGSAISVDDYPFFLILGVNKGDKWGNFSDPSYVNRLCLGIDKERRGIVMFEPDMVEGTEFQLMFRSADLDYMRPKFESAFQNLNGRKPVFAIYIDCVGRCAGYTGTDIEDALVIHEIVGDRVPVLGLYTGVEIAPFAGHPRALDWTGVFCLFSQGEYDASVMTAPTKGEHVPAKAQLSSNMLSEFSKRLIEQNAAKILALDTQNIAVRYELELKRRGFSLLAELAVSLRHTDDDHREIFIRVAKRLNAALNMHKTVVLVSDGKAMFKPLVLQGFSPEEQGRLQEKCVPVPNELINLCPAVVTSESCHELFEYLREEYDLPFFVASPVYLQGKASALLLTGRLVEEEPYFIRLSGGDMETVYAITELLGSVLVRLRLQDVTIQAETDALTGLWNRSGFRRMVEDYLNGSEKQAGTFMMIDVDYFKSVNDIYGHTAGDELLKACADAMRNVLRDTDILGRQGGDEFVVFCPGIKSAETAKQKAAQLAGVWKHIIPNGSDKHITASIGIALTSPNGLQFQELYDNADTALYQAKERGRNCYVLFESN